MALNWHCFANRVLCVTQLAEQLNARLHSAQADGAYAVALLAGGTTPIPLFEQLAQQSLAWERLIITPTDERWVPATDQASNTRLLEESFPNACVLDPRLGANRVDSTALWGEALNKHKPANVCLLGMGEDGHFASIFSGMPNLAAALDLDQPAGAIIAQAPSAPSARMSLNLALLVKSAWLGLLIFGDAKKVLLEQVLAGDLALPVRALLEQNIRDVEIYWAP